MLEELSMASKEMGALWGANYREVIPVIRAVKSVTTPIFPHMIRVVLCPESGTLKISPNQPDLYPLLPVAGS